MLKARSVFSLRDFNTLKCEINMIQDQTQKQSYVSISFDKYLREELVCRPPNNESISFLST